MKKLTIGFAALLSSVTTSSYAVYYTGSGPFALSVPNLCGGFNIGLTGIWLRTSAPHLDYAERFPSTTPINPEDPFGPLLPVLNDGKFHSVDPHLAWGYRINVGYVFPCTSNDLVIALAHVDRDDHDFFERGPGAIFPSFTSETANGTILIPAQPGVIDFVFNDPNFIDASLFDIFAAYDGVGIGGVPIEVARAKADFKYWAWDLEFGQYASLGCNTRIRLFGGVRGANFEHRFDAFYTGTSITDVTDFIGLSIIDQEFAFLRLDGLIINHQKSVFAGAGPRLGLNVAYTLNCGFGLIGEASTAILVGESDSDFRKDFHADATLTETVQIAPEVFSTASASTSFGFTENFKHSHQTRVVPNLEAKFALSYTYQFPRPYNSQLTLEAGYMSTHYFNTIDRLTNVAEPGPGPEFHNRHTIDTTLEGPYIGVQFVI